jgi:hypothetical protein
MSEPLWRSEQRRLRQEKRRAHDRSWYQAVGGAMAGGIIGMAILSESRQMFAYALLIAIAATLVGAFAGFVFGIPKTVVFKDGARTENNTYTNNTNLEEISDWLTKILVGAGLVELSNIFLKLKAFGSGFMSDDLPLGPSGWIVAPALVITYSICGFLLAYLWARIYMTEELETPLPPAPGTPASPTPGTSTSPTPGAPTSPTPGTPTSPTPGTPTSSPTPETPASPTPET